MSWKNSISQNQAWAILTFSLCLLFSGVAAAMQGGLEFVAVEPGKGVDVELAAGEFVTLRFRRVNCPLWVSARLLSGVKERHLPLPRERDLLASAIAAQDGPLTIEVVDSPNHGPCRVSFKVEERRRATAGDSSRLRAESHFLSGLALEAQQKGASSQAAVEEFELAAGVWQDSGQLSQAAWALRRKGTLLLMLGRTELARGAFVEALKFGAAAQGTNEIEGWERLCRTALHAGENDGALTLCKKALDLSRDQGYPRGTAISMSGLGEVHYFRGEIEASLQAYRQAESQWRQIGDPIGITDALLGIAHALSSLGSEEAALAFIAESFSLASNGADIRGTALAAAANGYVRVKQGGVRDGIASYRQARSIFERLGDPFGQATAHSGLGYAYSLAGQRANSLHHYGQALSLYEEIGFKSGVASHLMRLGDHHLAAGENPLALQQYRKALGLFADLQDNREKGVALRKLGQALQALDNAEEAQESFQSALSLNRATKAVREEAISLVALARLKRDHGSLNQASRLYRRSLALQKRSNNLPGQSDVHFELALLKRDRGKLRQALEQIREAVRIDEQIRSSTPMRGLRTTLGAKLHRHYELLIDLLMQMHRLEPSKGHHIEALEAVEKSNARSLLEHIWLSGMDAAQGVDPALAQKETELRGRLRELARMPRPTLEEMLSLDRELAEVSTAIEMQSLGQGTILDPQPLTASAIQKLIADPETLMLEFALGEERSYVWAVDQQSIQSFDLPPRKILERLTYEVRKLLSWPSSARLDDKDLGQRVAELSSQLLDPISRLGRYRRLLIIADGALHYLPFEILPEPNCQRQDVCSSGQPLVIKHEIARLPSASALSAIRREAGLRKGNAGGIAIFADPVFGPLDNRIEAAAAGSASSLPPELRSAISGVRMGAGDQVPRLRFSSLEAEAIKEAVGGQRISVWQGFDANLQQVLDPRLSRFRVIHLATHGILDETQPELAGVLLSLVDRDGHPQDGHLRLPDIYSLRLQADLVALSACSTALGKRMEGEGIVGLVSGFLYAGAKSVLASFWRVDDKATSVLMKSFYEHLFQHNLTPAAALRAAQLNLMKTPRWRSPFYWGAFGLHGDWQWRVDPGSR